MAQPAEKITLNLGQLADAIYQKTGEIAQANAKVKELETERHALEDQLLNRMDEAGTDIVRGSDATVSVSENIRPQIQNYDALTTFVLRRKALHLFERRISSTAYREMKESLGGKPVPGLNEFVQRKLNIRKLAS